MVTNTRNDRMSLNWELGGWKKDIIENYARQLMLERLREIQAMGLPIYTKSQYPSKVGKIISNVAFQ